MISALIFAVATSAVPDALVYQENDKILIITNERISSCPKTHKSAQVGTSANDAVQGCWVLNTSTYMVEITFRNKSIIKIPATSFKPFFMDQK